MCETEARVLPDGSIVDWCLIEDVICTDKLRSCGVKEEGDDIEMPVQ